MDKLRSSGSSGLHLTTEQLQQQIEQYPKNLIEQYLRASNKIKKIERVVFKRFAPSVADVQADFQRLAYSFEESGTMQYAAMCHIGYAKCESYGGSPQREAEAYVCAARDFLRAHQEFSLLQLRTVHSGFMEGALHCYTKAAERAVDVGVFKAAVLRELKELQQQLEQTSSFASPAHCINDLEIAADMSMQRQDYRRALQQFDDIVDNIYERKRSHLYGELLRRTEVLRLLLLVQLDLPPARQSPSHIKLIEHYYALAEHDFASEHTPACEQMERPGAHVPVPQQYALAEIICAWVERKMCDLKHLLKEFAAAYRSISTAERHLLKTIYAELSKLY